MPLFFRKLNQKGIVHLIPLLLILAGIIGSVYLVQKSGFQIFKPKASSQNVEFLPGECLASKDGKPALKCPNVNIKFTSPVDPDQRSDAGFQLIKTAYAHDEKGLNESELRWCTYETEFFGVIPVSKVRSNKNPDIILDTCRGVPDLSHCKGYKFTDGHEWAACFNIWEKVPVYPSGQTAPAAPAKKEEEKPFLCEKVVTGIKAGNLSDFPAGGLEVAPNSKTYIQTVNNRNTLDSDKIEYIQEAGSWQGTVGVSGQPFYGGDYTAPAQAGTYKLSVKINGVVQPKCTVNFVVKSSAPAAPPAVNTTSCDADGRLVTKTNGTVTSTQPCPDGRICKESSEPNDKGARCEVKQLLPGEALCTELKIIDMSTTKAIEIKSEGVEVGLRSKTSLFINQGARNLVDADEVEFLSEGGSLEDTVGAPGVKWRKTWVAPAQAGTYKLSVKINGKNQPKCTINFKVVSSPAPTPAATPTPTPGAGGRTGAPRCTTPTPCIYSEDDGSGVKCYSGKCSDGSATCGFNNGCVWVAGCSKQVACPAGGGESGDVVSAPAGGRASVPSEPAVRKEGITVNADCGDNPPMGAGIGERPEGYTWKSDCSNACRVNADCPVNDFDPDNVNPETSNWCYGFASGPRCLMLTKTGGLQERPARAAAPAADTRTVKTTTRFRFAEDPASLKSAQWRNYTAGGVTLPHVFKDQTLDNKPRFIYAEFEVVTKDAQGKTIKTEVLQSNPYPASITLFKEEAPAPASPANRDEPATGPIPANSDCKLYETTSVCGLGDFKTYNKCTDDKGQSGASLCSGTATQFYCEGSTNSQCISDSSRKGHYSCAACPNLKSRMGTGTPASGADDAAIPLTASCSYSPLAVSVNTPVTFTIGSTRQKVAVTWGGEVSGRVVVNNGTASITRSFSTPGYKQVFATVASGEDSYTVSCEQINVSAAAGSGASSGGASSGGSGTTTTTGGGGKEEYFEP